MNRIATVCGYEKSNIYHYFPNKETILYEIFQSELQNMIDEQRNVEKQCSHNLIEHLRLFIKHQLYITLRSKKPTDIMFDVELRNLASRRQSEIIALRRELEDILFNIINKGIESGIFMPVDARLTTFNILSMILNFGQIEQKIRQKLRTA